MCLSFVVSRCCPRPRGNGLHNLWERDQGFHQRAFRQHFEECKLFVLEFLLILKFLDWWPFMPWYYNRSSRIWQAMHWSRWWILWGLFQKNCLKVILMILDGQRLDQNGRLAKWDLQGSWSLQMGITFGKKNPRKSWTIIRTTPCETNVGKDAQNPINYFYSSSI